MKLLFYYFQSSVVALEKTLGAYIQGPTDKPFDIKTVQLTPATADVAKPDSIKATPVEVKKAPVKEVSFADELVKVPELARIPLGGLFKTCERQQLTEPETEYVVTVTKHVFNRFFVLQVIISEPRSILHKKHEY